MFRLGNIFSWPTKDYEVVKQRQDKQRRESEKICAQIIQMDVMIKGITSFSWSIESTEIGSGFYPTMQFLLGVQSSDDMIPQAPLQLYFSVFNPLLILSPTILSSRLESENVLAMQCNGAIVNVADSVEQPNCETFNLCLYPPRL